MPKGVYKRTPETRAILSAAHKGVSFTPERCAAMSEGSKNSYAVKANSESKKGVPLSPEHCAKISIAHTGIPKSPEHCAALSKAQKGVPHTTPAQIAADKANSESMRGGNDLVEHHYIYDHSDLSKNIVQMTRSDHMKLHILLKKLGYIVPHINMTEVN